MHERNYEQHIYKDPSFPIAIHLDTRFKNIKGFTMHWHEHIEMLYFTEGCATVTTDTTTIEGKKGDIVIINSNHLHTVSANDVGCCYQCLIVDKDFCNSFSVPIDELNFQEVVSDEPIVALFERILLEMRAQEGYYKPAIISLTLELLVALTRGYSTELALIKQKGNSEKRNMVKNAISYIGANYENRLTIDEICATVGFSKYHFCRTFKEITGKTVIEYINILRCNNARKLLLSKKYNVGESARLSGFNNLSYFTKIYKEIIGDYPSNSNIS